MGPTPSPSHQAAAMEDDPVVCEIPVHLAENLRGQIYMVQFPLRPSYRPMPAAPKHARIKPNNQILQLDYEVDQRGDHYDRDAEDYLKQKLQRLQSSSVPALTNYAVGVFRQGQLHLTPVKGVMQMRPSLAHIDAAVDEEEDMEVEEAPEPAVPEVKEVQFQFKKKQSERAITAIQNSYAYKKQQVNAEHWRELQVMEQSAIDEEFENLFSEREDEVPSGMSADEYLKALRYRSLISQPTPPTNPAETNADSEGKEESDDSPTVDLRSTLDPKFLSVYQVLATDHVLHFDALVALLPAMKEDEILEALEYVAVSINGVLIAKSALVCSGEGIASARDKILRELREHPTGVKRMDIVDKHNLEPDDVKKTLADIAVLDTLTRSWRLRLDADSTFARRFPAVAKVTEL